MNPERNQRVAQPITDIYLRIEDEILTNIGKKLRRDRELLIDGDFESWQLIKLSQLNKLTQENLITIARYSGLAIDEISELLEKEGYRSIAETDRSLDDAVRSGHVIRPPAGDSPVIRNILDVYQNQARQSFNLINSTMLQQSETAYVGILNEANALVITGVKTPQQAVREVASKWANKGIPALVDRAGKEWSTEAYVNMVIRTTSNNVANEMQFARMDDYEIDLVEVSSHIGARPRCAPFQGRIFSRSGTSDKYPPLSETSYGELAGLRGINCGHVFYPFVEGVSIPRPHDFTKEENDTAYKESQKQRYLERQIRYAKRELNMMSAMGDEEGVAMAKSKVRERQANIREFISETGRTRRSNREQLAINNPNVGGGNRL
ncbi:phage minor capsid protein [Halalkalibacterium ligniniphilum]|uniref:phage minor capsid protein n=1 Tax=Halalkalibacterium ligniniphilum TaxID=1134413 RepID=UPI000345ECAF|nr:phage minor capsid protein [Halalkalibacterium ligniniphilum]